LFAEEICAKYNFDPKWPKLNDGGFKRDFAELIFANARNSVKS